MVVTMVRMLLMMMLQLIMMVVIIIMTKMMVIVMTVMVTMPFMINNGNRTEWSLIRSVIIRLITKVDESNLLITSMITDRHRTTRSPITN